MTLQELKAEAYDILAQIEKLQLKLRQLNQEIGREHMLANEEKYGIRPSI
jgi:hypothetical protein